MNIVLFTLILIPILINASSPETLLKNTTTIIQLCCPTWEHYNITKHKCEPLQNDAKIKWNLEIDFLNGTVKELNILKNFIHKVNLPCEKPEALYWKINESIGVDEVSDEELCLTQFDSKNTRRHYDIVQLNCRLELHLFLAFKHEFIYFLTGFLLIPTLIVYIMLKPLHSNLMGKCFICYLICVLLANGIYVLIPQILRIDYHLPNLLYISIALFNFYINMVIVYWLNIIGYAAWKNFSDSNEDLNADEKKKRFILYSIYAWLMGALTTVPTILRNFSNVYKYCNKYEQSTSCVILTYRILYTDIYFAPAVMTILIINFLIFCCVAWKIHQIRRKVTNYNKQQQHENSIICLRLFILLGPHWIIMYLLKDFKYIEILIFIMNFIESIIIFTLFVLRKSVLKLIFKKK